MSHTQIKYKTAQADGLKIFYREAGNPEHPGLLLLHGHASGSHVFRNLIPLLSDSFHIVAPDYPGFGQSDMPSPKEYKYNFENVSDTIAKFTEVIGLKTFVIYTFDYGAPVGFKIFVKHPERITGIFSQSGNAYEDGLSPAFEGLRAWWANPDDPKHDKEAMNIVQPETLKWAYVHGVDQPELVSPDGPAIDAHYLARPGAMDIQRLMLLDYENVVKSYPKWQETLRKHKPKVVCVWGSNDPFFTPPGAEAFKKDIPNADVTIVQGAAHFLTDHVPEKLAEGIRKLL